MHRDRRVGSADSYGDGPFPIENRDLLSEGEHFEGGVGATDKEDADCSQGGVDEFGRECRL